MPSPTPDLPTASVHRIRHRPHRAAVGAVVVIAAFLGVTACGQNDAGDDVNDEAIEDAADAAEGTDPDLGSLVSDDEQRFVVTGAGSRDIVEGSEIEIIFGDEKINAYAGCNRIFGTYRLEGNTLIAGPLASTRMACPPELMDQDAWLIRLLESEPELNIAGDEMTLVGPDGTLALTSDPTSSDIPGGRYDTNDDDHTDPAGPAD